MEGAMLQVPMKISIAIIFVFLSIRMGNAFTKVRGYEVIKDTSGKVVLDPTKFKIITSKAVSHYDCWVSS